ncbi:glycosyltransferase involved in cell wall biosynthesis [Novosphingobium sp. PhB165]|uniref:glycosyltransferase n=1 Tax=Novosphingobium sp. PhB165 TaxID=2485105 RepID=UPI00104A3019|nr:glycosyltransferase [Novosphingobium sp. PhB165]TCM20896.1 glycosyltransferase involved in cell wall biosynthesis [Novosphingobium sp. PhB165]
MTQPLRIVLPIHSFEPGGVERVALGLARHWQDLGHEVVVVLGRDEGLDRANAPRTLDYRIRPNRSPLRFPTARLETLWMIWSLFHYLLRNRADVIFCPGNTYTIVCVMMKLLLRGRCPPVVVKVSNDLVRADKTAFRRRWYRCWLKINGLLLERFVGLAEPMFEEIVEGMGVGDHRVSTIHDPALDRARLERLLAIERERKQGQGHRFVAVGRLAAQKNLPLLLMAFAEGFRPGDRLTIVGEGCGRAALERQVRQLALQNHVTFAGHVACPDPFLCDADCLILSSNYEGVPAVVIEAIAAGLPVIATDCCSSMKSLLGHGTRGVIVPVGDAPGLAAAIAGCAALPKLCAVERGYAAHFTLERAAAAYLATMREAIAQGREARFAAAADPA